MEENKLYTWVEADKREPDVNGKYVVKMSVGSISPKIQIIESTFIKGMNSRSSWSGAMDWNYVVAWQEEYTPPAPLELEELEKMVQEGISKSGNLFPKTQLTSEWLRAGLTNVWQLLKPQISAILQGKDEEIKELNHKKEFWANNNQGNYDRWKEANYERLDFKKQISSLQTQLQTAEEKIKQLEAFLEGKEVELSQMIQKASIRGAWKEEWLGPRPTPPKDGET